jgi:hypothetical protein
MGESMSLAAGAGRSLRQLQAAGRTLELLRTTGLRALPIKGAAIAEEYCEDLTERPMDDVDLLAIDPFGPALETLTAAGFTTLEHGGHASALRDPWFGVAVELHREVTTAGLFPVDREGLWARSRVTRGLVGRIPGAEDLLVLAAVHAAFQHALVLRRDQWRDFQRLVERGPVDAKALAEIAAASRAEGAVAASLRVAAAVTGWTIPASLDANLAMAPALARLVAKRQRSSELFLPPSPPRLAAVRWALLKGRRTELLRQTLLPPSAPALVPSERRFSALRGVAVRFRSALRRAIDLLRKAV